MVWIAGTGVPSRVTATCPRCRSGVRVFDSIGSELTYQCGGCEWTFTFGAGTSPLATNNSVTAGTSTALPFASGGTQFLLNQVLYISDGASSEIVVVNGTPTGTSVPVSDLDFNHASGKNVTVAVASPAYPSVQSILQTPY